MAQPGHLPAAWILAGGLGTRLATVLPDRAKALAPIGDRPFLTILLDRLRAAGFDQVLLLLGARHQGVLDFLAGAAGAEQATSGLRVQVSIESSPLGTGGAIKNARAHADAHPQTPFFLLNGDTYVDFDAGAMLRRHRDSGALVTLAAIERADCSRFGRLDVTPEDFLRAFREKTDTPAAGLINAGVYVMQPEVLRFIAADRPVSLEREVFPALLAAGQRIAVSRQSGTFFDIGTPDDLRAFEAFARSAPMPTVASSSSGSRKAIND